MPPFWQIRICAHTTAFLIRIQKESDLEECIGSSSYDLNEASGFALIGVLNEGMIICTSSP